MTGKPYVTKASTHLSKDKPNLFGWACINPTSPREEGTLSISKSEEIETLDGDEDIKSELELRSPKQLRLVEEMRDEDLCCQYALGY